MNKKGIVIRRLFTFFYHILYAAFVMALTVVIIKIVVSMATQTQQLESDVFMHRVMQSQGIMFKDPDTHRIYPGIIDLEKFNDDSLVTDYDYLSEKRLSAKIIVYDEHKQEVKSMYFNKNLYTYLKPLIGKVTGSSGGTRYEKQYPVTYKDETEFKNGFIFIEVLRQND